MTEKSVTQKRSFFFLFLYYTYRIIVNIGRLFYKLYYYNGSKQIPPIRNPILLESATSLAEKIRNKELTSVEVVEAFIERIKEVNGLLNAVVDERYDEARAEAAAADAVVRSSITSTAQLAREQPLLGVPFTTKDCIMVKGLIQTAGLVWRKGFRGDDDAVCIRNVRAAGAIPIALTNTSEACIWWESHNHLHGRTNNPYDTTRIAGGSSGGEGCIQSVCGSAFGIGSDYGGSVRMPAFFNGIFGHKPSSFVVSNAGEFPEVSNELQDAFVGLGPMCRKAADLRLILKTMIGKNAEELCLDEDVDLSTTRLFYQKNYTDDPLMDTVDEEIQSVMTKAIEYLAARFGIRPQKSNFINLEKTTEIWDAGFAGGDSIAQLLTGHDSPWYLLLEIGKNMLGRSNNTFISLASGIAEQIFPPHKGDPEYAKLMQLRDVIIQEFKDLLGRDGVYFFPTHPTPAPYHNEPVIRSGNFYYTSCINTLGFPATSIPMGLNKDGLPIGFQVVAAPNNDRLCLAIAEEMDRAFGGWVSPSTDKKRCSP